MFCVIKNVLIVLLLQLLLGCQLSFCKILKIGGIFNETNFIKMEAFTKAIISVNEETDFLDGYELRPVIKVIPDDNPFEAMKATCSLIEEGVVGILGPESEDNSNVVQSICDAKEIPLIDVRWDDQPLTGIVINIYPYQEVLTKVYLKIIEKWQWKDFVILYESNESLKRVSKMLHMYDDKGHKILVRQLDRNKTFTYREELKKLWQDGATHFVIDCSIDILRDVLLQAQQVGLMTNNQHYIITNLDMHTIDLTPFQYAETNITGMRFIDPENDAKIRELAENLYPDETKRDYGGYVRAWKIRMDVALITDAIKMFVKALSDLPLDFVTPDIVCGQPGSWIHGTSLVNLLKGLTFDGLTGTIKFDNIGYRSDFGLDIIELTAGGVIKVGGWNATNKHGIYLTRQSVYVEPPDQSQTLINTTFVVLTCLTEPFAMYKEDSTQRFGNDQYEGYAIDLIEELAKLEGFNYTFKIREDKMNGAFDKETQKWTGMIGDVIYERADLAITDLTITRERTTAVDFTTPFMNLGISILYQKPRVAPPSFFSFADPFALEVWELLAAAYFGVSISLFIMGRISCAEWNNPYPCIEEPEHLINQLSISNCFWFNTGSIMQQGSEIAPVGISTRMIAGSWWFFTLIMVSSYTANLAAFLSTENPDADFENVFELVRRAPEKGIRFGAKAKGATANFFRDAKHIPEYQQIYDYMEQNPGDMVKDNQIGVDRAASENERYAFFMESSSIEYQVQRKCNLNQVGRPLDEKGYGIAIRKNSSYRSALSSAILRLQENGKLSELKKKWWEEQRGGGQCIGADEESSDANPLNLKNVGGVFWVSIGGTLLAAITVIVETILTVIKKAVKTKTPIKDALTKEFKFYCKFSKLVKPVADMYNNPDEIEASVKSKSEDNEELVEQHSLGNMSHNTTERRNNLEKQNSHATY